MFRPTSSDPADAGQAPFFARYASLIAAQAPPRDAAGALAAHAFACAIASAPEGVSPLASLGLSGRAYDALTASIFPGLWSLRATFDRAAPAETCDEHAMLHALLLSNRAGRSIVEVWLASILAQRALEPGHLWTALGLFERAELRRLLEAHFPALAARNVKEMRWKRFFYRELCASQGFQACPVPDCRDCSSMSECFAVAA